MFIFYLIGIVGSLSLIFAILNFAFHFVNAGDFSGTIFLLSAACIFLSCLLKEKNKGFFYMPLICIALPLFFVQNIPFALFLAITVIFSFYYIKKDIYKLNYTMLIDEFKKGFAAVIAIFILAIVTDSAGPFGRFSAPFLIVYLICSIALLRSLRNYEITRDRKFINMSNLIYGVIIIFVSFTMGIEAVRNYMLNILKTVYFAVVDFVVYVISHTLGFMVYIFQDAFEALERLVQGKSSKPILDKLLNSNQDQSQSPFRNYVNKALVNSRTFNIIIQVIMAAVILYIILRLFNGKKTSEKSEEQYTENKDFVVFDRSGKKQRPRRFLRPDSYRDFIRYYYLKFLRLADKHQTNIKKSDTTLEISRKAAADFDKDVLKNMRDIYIKARYGDTDLYKEDFEHIKKYYKELKK